MERAEPLPLTLADLVEPVLAARRAGTDRRPFVLGIAGAQGSGKSTLADELARRHRCPTLSLDDLYLDGAGRRALARSVHPLLRTRGVPGTHDPARGLALIEALGRSGTVALPRFDKHRDEPGPSATVAGPVPLLIVEGWCLGARPQPPAALEVAVNALEATQDPDGRWRGFVNRQLATRYRALFDRIDLLVFLAAPDFDVVAEWRTEQERASGGPMSDAAIRAFVEHYRRITEDMLRRAPRWADLTISLDPSRRPIAVVAKGGTTIDAGGAKAP